MDWEQALEAKNNTVIRLEGDSETCINGPSSAVNEYDVNIEGNILICGIPSASGVDRVLEEFELPKKNWH